MRSRNRSLILLTLLGLGFLLLPGSIFLAHAATGQVCLLDPSTASGSSTTCPASAYVFNGPPPTAPQVSPTQLKVAVAIVGSDATNGFSMILKADHTILRPAGVDLTGTVIPGPVTILLECLSNVVVTGSTCTPNADNIDTLDLAIAGSPGLVSPTPTTGLLFTAIYNITGAAPVAGISIVFQTDPSCNPSSVAMNVCLTIPTVVGTQTTPDAETAQTGTFNNSAGTAPWVAITAASSSVTALKATSSPTVVITATAENLWPGFSADTISFTAVAAGGFSAPSLSPTSCMTGGTSCTTTATFSTAASGAYLAVIQGNYVSSDTAGSGLTDSLIGPVTIRVNVTDFSVSLSSPSVSFPASSTATLTATVSGMFGFSGSVALSQGTTSPTTGLTISFSPSTVSLTSGAASVTSSATFSSSTPGTYRTQLKATSGGQTRTNPTFTVTVGAAAPLSANPSSLSVAQAFSLNSTITVAAVTGFSGTVALSATSASGISTAFTPASLTGSGSSTLTISVGSSVALGSYVVNVTASAGQITRFVLVTVLVVKPDVTITSNPQSLTIPKSTMGSTTIQVTSLYGFSGTVSLSGVVSSGSITQLPTVSFSQTTLSLPAAGSRTSTATISAISVPAGAYILNVTVTSGAISEFTIVFLTVPPPDFGISSSPTSLTLNAGTAGTSTITISPLLGFTGDVILSTNSTSCTITPGTVTGSGTATLSCTFSSYQLVHVTVTGSNTQPLSHSTTIAFTVQDFSLTAVATVISVNTGSSAQTPINVAGLGGLGFAGNVTLTFSAPSGLDTSLTSSLLQGPGTSTLKVSTNTANTYVVKVTGTSGSLSHSVNITVNASVAGTSDVFGLPAAEFYGIVGLIVAVAIAGGVLAVRRSRKRKTIAKPGP